VQEEQKMLFKEFLEQTEGSLNDIQLCHKDIDEEYPTLVDFGAKTLTDEGLKHFADILNAEVDEHREEKESNIVYVTVKKVKYSKVSELTYAYCGYCSEENYQLWFK
jgi:hypothetical protein